MGDSRLIEQPVGHEHPLAASIHRVVIRGGHDPDSHRLQIVDDRLRPASGRAVVVRVRLVDYRTFHVGVGRVGRAHHVGQCLKASIAHLTHRATDNDVPDGSEGEGLGDFHRELFGCIASRLWQRNVSLRRPLPPGEGIARHSQGSHDQRCGGKLLIPQIASRFDLAHGKLLNRDFYGATGRWFAPVGPSLIQRKPTYPLRLSNAWESLPRSEQGNQMHRCRLRSDSAVRLLRSCQKPRLDFRHGE